MAKKTEQYEEDIQIRLYRLLKSVKAEKIWTNKDLAIALDVSVSLVEKWCSKNVSSFVKNHFGMLSKLAQVSGYSTASLVTKLEGSEYERELSFDDIKNLASTSSFHCMINEILKFDEKERNALNSLIMFYARMDQSQRKAIFMVFDLMCRHKNS